MRERVIRLFYMSISIIKESISHSVLAELAKERFGDMVKAVVDIEKELMVVDEQLHSDEEIILIQDGSSQGNLWGINIYPDNIGDERIEFDSMINVRPRQGNRSRDVENKDVRNKIIDVVNKLIL